MTPHLILGAPLVPNGLICESGQPLIEGTRADGRALLHQGHLPSRSADFDDAKGHHERCCRKDPGEGCQLAGVHRGANQGQTIVFEAVLFLRW